MEENLTPLQWGLFSFLQPCSAGPMAKYATILVNAALPQFLNNKTVPCSAVLLAALPFILAFGRTWEGTQPA